MQKEYQSYIAGRDQSLFIAGMGTEEKMTEQKSFLPHHFPFNLNALDKWDFFRKLADFWNSFTFISDKKFFKNKISSTPAHWEVKKEFTPPPSQACCEISFVEDLQVEEKMVE